MNKPTPHFKRLPAAVVALGLVSFFTDLSSEMIYPLLPLFLATTMGAGAWVIGLIEGVAESTAAALKLVSGIFADRVRRRKPMLLAGYGLSSVARPLIGLAGAWPAVLALRFADRVGKGVRTSPRDALIADVTAPEIRGAAFGFHRAMDHAGAVVGPLAAAALLVGAGLELGQVFLLAAIPGVAVLATLVAGVREPARGTPPAPPRWDVRRDWHGLGRPFHRYLLAMLVFTLGNSADAFLLLRLAQSGVTEAWVAVLWSLHHVVKMAATYIGGRLSDRLGRRPMVLAGWAVYAGGVPGLCRRADDARAHCRIHDLRRLFRPDGAGGESLGGRPGSGGAARLGLRVLPCRGRAGRAAGQPGFRPGLAGLGRSGRVRLGRRAGRGGGRSAPARAR